MLDAASFVMQNPWRFGRYEAKETHRRELLDEILDWVNEPDIIVIVGSRQVGKTTLLFQLIESLLSAKIAPDDIFYFNLDDLGFAQFFDSPTEFVEYIRDHSQERAYVFIDEVQRLENPGLFLKYVYDLKSPIKLLVTGSSSLEIRAKISESLTGRKQLFQLHPFSFAEFIAVKWTDFPSVGEEFEIKDRQTVINTLTKVQTYYGKTIQKWLNEYLSYGGYPRVILSRDSQQKIAHLREIFTSYIQRDIKD